MGAYARLYLDVETYRPEKERAFVHERVIAIGALFRRQSAARCSGHDVNYFLFTEWKYGSEFNLISEFYGWFIKLIQSEKIIVIGFNILRFDIPLLIQKGVEYGVGNIAELNRLWHNTHTIDYQQAVLPYYDGFPRLEDLVEAASKAGIDVPKPYGSGKEVKVWYEKGEYDNIEKRLQTELNALCVIDLNFKRIYGIHPLVTL